MPSSDVYGLLTTTLDRGLAAPADCDSVRRELDRLVPAEQAANLDALLNRMQLSYRDAVLIQFAYALETPGLDTTIRHAGARSVAKKLGSYLASKHVPAVADAYQNIGKNTSRLDRGNVAEFDSLLRWARSASIAQLRVCFEYACLKVAEKARPVTPMPELNVARLSFGAVMGLFTRMLDTPSEGAHEQYVVASLLHALIEQTNETQYRVETKKLNAADSSSRAAGDVQIMTGNRVLEAYEVTANDWGTKLEGVAQKLRTHDLSRIHIIATGASDYRSVLPKLAGQGEDVSVLDLRHFCATILSSLTRNHRNMALIRLYENLDRYGGDVARVNQYVAFLAEEKLTVASAATTAGNGA